MLQAFIGRFRVKNDYFADWNASLEKEIQRKCYHLGLASQRCQHCMCIIRHTHFPRSIETVVRRLQLAISLPAWFIGGLPHAGKSLLTSSLRRPFGNLL